MSRVTWGLVGLYKQATHTQKSQPIINELLASLHNTGGGILCMMISVDAGEMAHMPPSCENTHLCV